MPKVVKQTAKPKPVTMTVSRPNMGVLQRIESVASREVKGLKFVLYGRSKTGKTRLACSFPKPLLLIGSEDGTKSVSNVKGVDFVRLNTSAELDELSDMLRSGRYLSAALDTAGGIQDMILKEVLGLDDIPVQKSWGLADRSTWGIVGQQFKERLRRFTDLADQTGMNLITIAHERNFSDESDGELITPTIGAALTPSAAGFVHGEHDYVCQTFIRQEQKKSVTRVGNTDVETFAPTGRMEYCLRVGTHSVYLVGFRVPVGTVLPDVVVDPSYTKLIKLIKGEK